MADGRLGRQLVLDELFDLSLYEALLGSAPPDLRGILERLIPIERRHFHFWRDFFDEPAWTCGAAWRRTS